MKIGVKFLKKFTYSNFKWIYKDFIADPISTFGIKKLEPFYSYPNAFSIIQLNTFLSL